MCQLQFLTEFSMRLTISTDPREVCVITSWTLSIPVPRMYRIINLYLEKLTCLGTRYLINYIKCKSLLVISIVLRRIHYRNANQEGGVEGSLASMIGARWFSNSCLHAGESKNQVSKSESGMPWQSLSLSNAGSALGSLCMGAMLKMEWKLVWWQQAAAAIDRPTKKKKRLAESHAAVLKVTFFLYLFSNHFAHLWVHIC